MIMMNFKSTLWALAFACAAVSCSDDVDDGLNNGNNGSEQNGETAKINVAINTETITRATTKATPGEDGDGADVSEVGAEDEYKVNDVTLILYTRAEGEPSNWNIKSGCKLVAAGWTDQIGVMENSGATTGDNNFPNGKMTTVEVAVKDGTPSLVGEQATTYGVIAVTNLGETDGKALVSKIAATDGYNEVADLDKQLFDNYSTENGHVMSSHDIEGSAGGSQVTFEANSEAIPSVSVYVERLSAKIRLSENESHENFKYTIASTMVEEETPTQGKNDEIQLTDVAIVNQLSSGSFLLKRVSEDVANGTTELPTNNASNDIIIGDEKGSAMAAATNYVIDPWTRSKAVPIPFPLPSYSGTTTVSLTYINQFTESTFGSLWKNYSDNSHTVIIDPSKLDAQNDLFLCYTQENTTGIAASVNGYTTGALFKATYYPARWMALISTEGGEKGSVKPQDITYEDPKTAKTFFTYITQGKEYIFENYNAILAYIIAKAGMKDDDNASITYYSFTKTGDALDTNFGDNIAKLRNYADEDPFGYIKAMVAEYDKTQAEPAGTADYKAIDEYLTHYKPAEGDATTAFNQRVKVYTSGVCYYPYWIKHADNGVNQGTGSVGVMEFGIVRNNIYDMEVTGISGLGLSEVDVTDPENPDEDTSLKIQVNLYVKNWVVRSNGGIIL